MKHSAHVYFRGSIEEPAGLLDRASAAQLAQSLLRERFDVNSGTHTEALLGLIRRRVAASGALDVQMHTLATDNWSALAGDHPFPLKFARFSPLFCARALWQIALPPLRGVAAISQRPLGGWRR